MINLQLDIYYQTKHAQEIMRELGITYQIAVPQSINDSWHFWNCKNVPDVLPDFISPLKNGPQSYLGHGLSQEMIDSLLND